MIGDVWIEEYGPRTEDLRLKAKGCRLRSRNALDKTRMVANITKALIERVENRMKVGIW